ncbi:MAG: tetratricopeptide repeat protein [Leptolyngbyaceae cyanobacterium CRU_2_3]|nr:tetratricopeptide repeat protein [Leptolyngbyaceae cyanobacterium CRU_2_3]
MLFIALWCGIITPISAVRSATQPHTDASAPVTGNPVTGNPVTGNIHPNQLIDPVEPIKPIDPGKFLYESGRWVEAATVLQQAVIDARSQGNRLAEAIALSNLSLVQQQLGNWVSATQTIEQAISLLQTSTVQTSTVDDHNSQDDHNSHPSVLAQALEVQGRLQLSRGEAEAALNTWKRVETYADRLQDHDAVVRSRINQAQALQALGMYRRAITLLEQLVNSFSSPSPMPAPTPAQVVALRSLGDAPARCWSTRPGDRYP